MKKIKKKKIIKFLKKIFSIREKNVSTLSSKQFINWWSDYQQKNIDTDLKIMINNLVQDENFKNYSPYWNQLAQNHIKILTEDGFKFELLGTQENYNFKLESYPENLDLAEIPIEFTINGNTYKITANFSDDNPYTFSTKEITFKKNFGYNSFHINKAQDFNDFINQLIKKIKNNPTAEVEISLGQTQEQRGYYHDAANRYERAYRIRQKILGETNPLCIEAFSLMESAVTMSKNNREVRSSRCVFIGELVGEFAYWVRKHNFKKKR